MLDTDFAALYEVETRVLVQAVKRNQERFPEDSCSSSRSQRSNARGHGDGRYARYAFTEQDVAMHSTVLNSPRGIAVNIEIMRAFVWPRLILASNKELARRLDQP